jgi:hypothetical protein
MELARQVNVLGHEKLKLVFAGVFFAITRVIEIWCSAFEHHFHLFRTQISHLPAAGACSNCTILPIWPAQELSSEACLAIGLTFTSFP